MISRCVLAAALTALPLQALADPQYRADQIESHFVQNFECPPGQVCVPKSSKTRKVCVGTDQSCAQQEAEAKDVGAFDMLITFELGSDRLSAQARENLAEFAKAMKGTALRDAVFNVDGHTDARGTDDFNLALSQRRAESVVLFLESQGIPRSRLAPAGYGEARPRVADPFAAINRRVEATIRTR